MEPTGSLKLDAALRSRRCRANGGNDGGSMSNTTRSTAISSASVDSALLPAHLGASRLINASVYDAAGKRLGRIEEIILDRRTGGVRFVVIALGGFLGIGRARFAVPWHVLVPDTGDGRCTVDRALMPFTAVPVPEDDPWLQRNGRTRGREIPYLVQLLQRQGRSDAIPPERHVERR